VPVQDVPRLDGFELDSFVHEGVARPVYEAGVGPGIVVMHEIPGITPEVAGFGRRLVQAGFTVRMPVMFGTPGKSLSVPYAISQVGRACIAKEFAVLASGRASPITDWLRALCRALHAELGGPGVGALGMCLTGNFALALMVDDAVMAPVLCQPSLPFPVTPDRAAALHLDEEQLSAVRRRAAAGAGVLGLRFTSDLLCPAARFRRLRSELGSGFEGIEVDSSWGNPHGIPMIAHSVLTNDLVDEEGHPTRAALDRVLAFFHERLDPPAGDEAAG
jgi:dienelactone hydrolase